jgi:hypothetical protein
MKMHTIRITSCKSEDRNQSLKRAGWPLSGGPDRVTSWKFQSRKLLVGLTGRPFRRHSELLGRHAWPHTS